MSIVGQHPRPAARMGRRRLLTWATAALLVASAIAPGSAAAATQLSFGTVSLGASKSLEQTLPLDFSLSDLPAGTVVYSGGNSAIDFFAGQLGLSIPVTSTALLNRIGDVTATYHLQLQLAIGTQFSVNAPGCSTATGSCLAEITFSPTLTGPITDRVNATLTDVDVTGGGTLGSFVELIAPFLVDSFESQLTVDLSGNGVPNTGVVSAEVSVPTAAACLELSTSAVDFGELDLGDENQPATPPITVTNCSSSDGTLYASGTDATGTSAHWALADTTATCATGLAPDTFRLGLDAPGVPATLSLATDAKTFHDLAGGESVDHTARIWTACPGSTGSGRTMTMEIRYLVTTE